MTGPGGVPADATLVSLKPHFLERVDLLSQALAANPAAALAIRDDLDVVMTSAELLAYGENKGLYTSGAESDHFRDHWLHYPGHFPGVPARKRFQVIRVAFREAAHAIATSARPVKSAWVAGGSDFAAVIDATGAVINLTFYTPQLGPVAASDPSYGPDESVTVIRFDDMRDEIILEPGFRQNV